MTGRECLFSGDHVDLVLNGDPTNASLCVTFSSLNPVISAQTKHFGFAEKFLNDRNVPALHFIAKQNHWWQVPDMADCLRLAKSVVKTASRRVGYGSSMGGYGAIISSRALDLQAVAAFAPQYSIDPAVVPWEKRWREYANQIKSFDEKLESGPDKCDLYVFYDPIDPDGVHVNLISETRPLKRIELPGFGHLVMKELNARGCLEPIVMGLIQNSVDAESIIQIVDLGRAEKRDSQQA